MVVATGAAAVEKATAETAVASVAPFGCRTSHFCVWLCRLAPPRLPRARKGSGLETPTDNILLPSGESGWHGGVGEGGDAAAVAAGSAVINASRDGMQRCVGAPASSHALNLSLCGGDRTPP